MERMRAIEIHGGSRAITATAVRGIPDAGNAVAVHVPARMASMPKEKPMMQP